MVMRPWPCFLAHPVYRLYIDSHCSLALSWMVEKATFGKKTIPQDRRVVPTP